jgi:tetratricopeptide (TPR) repeat protein
MIAAWTGNIPMLELFASRGADLNKTNAIGEQALLHAAWKGQLAAVRWLLERGATINRQGKQWAALHYAAFAGHDMVVSDLLERGADVNALSTNGSTPLMMAAREGREGIAVRLLQAGADAAVRNEWDDDALRWAARNNNVRIARLIETSDPTLRKPLLRPDEVVKRSIPILDEADKLLAEARRLEAAGKRNEAFKAYRDALISIRRSETNATKRAEPRQLTGLRISARRAAPEVQEASLRYERPALAAAPENATAKVGADSTALANDNSTISNSNASISEVDVLLAKARALEEQGKRSEALALFRQAAGLLRR